MIDFIYSNRIQFISIFISLFIMIGIIRLTIKGKLREEYSIIWIVIALFLILFSTWRAGIDFFADALGVIDPPNLVFTFSIFLLFIYLIHLSVVISKLQNDNKKLAQEIALLKIKFDKIKTQVGLKND
jgi:hypothetical protein